MYQNWYRFRSDRISFVDDLNASFPTARDHAMARPKLKMFEGEYLAVHHCCAAEALCNVGARYLSFLHRRCNNSWLNNAPFWHKRFLTVAVTMKTSTWTKGPRSNYVGTTFLKVRLSGLTRIACSCGVMYDASGSQQSLRLYPASCGRQRPKQTSDKEDERTKPYLHRTWVLLDLR